MLSRIGIMWVFPVLLVVSVLVAFVIRRRDPQSRDSVDQQRQRLDALRTAVGAADDDPEHHVLPVARPIVPTRATRGRSSRRGGSQVALVVLSLVVVVAAVVLVAQLVGGGGGNDTNAGRDTAGTKADAPSSSTSTTTTTTAPPVTVVGRQGSTITVAVPTAQYSVLLNARAACWMRAEGPNNQVIVTTTMKAGAMQPIPGNGPMTLRLGNPGGVDVSVDGQPLALPLPQGTAVNVEFTTPGTPPPS